MPKTILLVHGRGFKPPKKELQKLWFEALRFGIERDHPAKLAAFNSAKVELVYYGDISNQFLKKATGKSVPSADIKTTGGPSSQSAASVVASSTPSTEDTFSSRITISTRSLRAPLPRNHPRA